MLKLYCRKAFKPVILPMYIALMSLTHTAIVIDRAQSTLSPDVTHLTSLQERALTELSAERWAVILAHHRALKDSSDSSPRSISLDFKYDLLKSAFAEIMKFCVWKKIMSDCAVPATSTAVNTKLVVPRPSKFPMAPSTTYVYRTLFIHCWPSHIYSVPSASVSDFHGTFNSA